MVALALTLGTTAVLAAWRSSMDGIGLFEARISLVVFCICITLLSVLMLEVLRSYREERDYRRWLHAAE